MWGWLIKRYNRMVDRRKEKQKKPGRRNWFFPWICAECGYMFPPSIRFYDDMRGGFDAYYWVKICESCARGGNSHGKQTA